MANVLQIVKRGSCAFILIALASIFINTAILSHPLNAYAVNADAKVNVASVSANPGEIVEVPVTITDNPGVLGAILQVEYDEGLTLVDAVKGDALAALSMTKPGSLSSPCKFNWDAVDIAEADVHDGTMLTLVFQVAEDVKFGSELHVAATASNGVFYDRNLSDIGVACTAGMVSVVSYIPGDLNGDKVVDSKDVIQNQREIVGGYEQIVNIVAGDVDDDCDVNSKDVILMRRFLVGGYEVVLKYSHMKPLQPDDGEHKHSLEAFAAHSPTCIDAGNIAYWRCKTCGKYYSDALCKNEIELADTAISAVGHKPVIDPAVPATRTTKGLTEGSHCSICNEVLIAQQETEPLSGDEYSITYDIANGDAYIARQGLANPNPSSYRQGDTIKLKNLSLDGYKFLGWYDGAGEGSTKVTSITSSDADDIELYAHWQIITYTVQLEAKAKFVDQDTLTYTVNRGLALPNPSVSNYEFRGWSDSTDGTVYGNRIPVGTAKNLMLESNWTSQRNKVSTIANPKDPYIVESEEDNAIVIAYEIGRIDNVPMNVVHDFGYISGNGVTKTATETYTKSTTETDMVTLANVVEKATTDSSNWTLSKDWNETTTRSEECSKTQGWTEEEINTYARTDSQNWNISNSSYGNMSTISSSGSSNNWINETKTKDYDKSVDNTKWKVGAELTSKVSVGASLPIKMVQLSASAELGSKLSGEYGKDVTNTSYSGVETFQHGSGNSYSNVTSSADSGWNNSSSYGGSSAVSRSKSLSKALSESITNKTGYGKSYSTGGHESQGFAHSDLTSSTDSYSATTTFGTTTGESFTNTWTTAATKEGYHRWITAGTAHVFGVIGYDIATDSFFTYTFTMMDDETHDFEDFSVANDSFSDEENGVISFEVPYEEVMNAVSDRVAKSDGLQVDLNTGKVTKYYGDDSVVVIPEYYNAGDGDVVKVTGLAEGVFKGNDQIEAVVLSDYITDIPADSFNGCSSLQAVVGKGVKTIGDRAFANCIEHGDAGVYSNIEALGDSAFAGIDHLYVNAHDDKVALAAMKSGAKNLTLNLGFVDEDALNGKELKASDAFESFELNGNFKTFNGLKIVSDAAKTILAKITVNGKGSFPVRISSVEAEFNQSNITADGIALVLTADNCNIGLRGTTMVSSVGENAFMLKNAKLYETGNNVVGNISVGQKTLKCGTVENPDLLKCTDIVDIDAETFNNMLNPYTLVFNANGGECSENSREVYNGAAVGELPVPKRDYYSFEGWYLDDGENAIEDTTVLPMAKSQTVVARWAENPPSDWVLAADVPEGAQIIGEKWTYNQTIYKKVVDSYTYYRWCSYYDNTWCQDSCWVNNSSVYHEITVKSPLRANANKFADKGGKASQLHGPHSSCSHKREGQSYWWPKSTNYKDVVDRVESKESTTEPSGNNISNVTKWVQYRSKTAPLAIANL